MKTNKSKEELQDQFKKLCTSRLHLQRIIEHGLSNNIEKILYQIDCINRERKEVFQMLENGYG